MADNRNQVTETDLVIWRKRLRFRAWHRGTRELDLILGTFADTHLESFDSGQLTRFEALMEESEPDIYNWYTGRQAVPMALDHDVMSLLLSFRLTEVRP